jgi:hypothetical protein
MGFALHLGPMTPQEDKMDVTTAVRRSLQAARISAALVAVALLSTSCAGGGSPSAGASTGSASAVAYSACMRSHGVPNFPDPSGNGQAVVKADPQRLGVSTAQYNAARQACLHLLPNTGSTQEQQQQTQCAMAGHCSQAVVQHWMSGLRTLAQCLRTHGVPNWPDPILWTAPGHGPQALPHFPYEQAGIDHHSAAILAKVQTCVNQTGFQGLPLP